ncbi:DUF4942 domain-containing protein [Azotobacter chroococcum]|uniref:DUF4942 domain-containing protein n=1 Tax=Azotobacter chroococcum TaxID=353 RepID=UPI0010ADEA76|nr:DUF4942 domain-containing protein [Azotobacter chroococcum]TKD44944.1 DUF4942 domain-containing protein [Azotobacter chroococcum]
MQFFEQDRNDSPVILGDVVDQFFAPVQFDALTQLASEFQRLKARITEVHGIIAEEKVSGVMGYFFSGNSSDQYGHSAMLRHTSAFNEIFNLDGALNDLTATFWSRALKQTDLLEHMPQARRNQWHECLNAWRQRGYKRGKNPELDMPEFNLDNLRATIHGLMARRAEFLAERVDGIFRNLSRSHVTNTPEGFSKRMILNHIFSDYGTIDHTREGYIHDLRLVIAKFMGRDEPKRDTTTRLLNLAKAHRGEWIEADCGSLRVRAYKVGTAHLEVHPDLAWRLNGILAFLHPMAIPESARTRPKRAKACGFKSKALFDRPISNAAAGVLAAMEQYFTLEPSTSRRREYDRKFVPNTLCVRYSSAEPYKHLLEEVSSVLEALGGVACNGGKHKNMRYWQFAYNPEQVVRAVAVSGQLPDARAHQFYPTPAPVAERLVQWLDIQPAETCLEPQAGQGGIADQLPKDRTLCVEISPLHCEILREKGHTAIEGDFLAWNPGTLFDVIACNPPYSEGRWQAHLRHASSLVEAGGRLGAVLPLSARQQAAELLPGFDLEFSAPIDNAFAGTSISVLLLKATKAKPKDVQMGLGL